MMSARSSSSASMVTLPSYSRFAPVTVARWILLRSMLRYMGSSSCDSLGCRGEHGIVDQTGAADEDGQCQQGRPFLDGLDGLDGLGVDQLGVVDARQALARQHGVHARQHSVGTTGAGGHRVAAGGERA